MLEQMLDRWYQAARRRWQRIAIATFAGAVIAVAGSFQASGSFAMQYWPAMALLGAGVGFVGCCLLAIQEQRYREGRPLPWIWRHAYRATWVVAVGLAILLIPLLIYTIWFALQQ